MRPLRYSINVTLDGCCDHQAGIPDEETHRHAMESIASADALLFGRVIYQMMEAAFREPGRTGVKPEWMDPWMMPFARTIHAAKNMSCRPPWRRSTGTRSSCAVTSGRP